MAAADAHALGVDAEVPRFPLRSSRAEASPLKRKSGVAPQAFHSLKWAQNPGISYGRARAFAPWTFLKSAGYWGGRAFWTRDRQGRAPCNNRTDARLVERSNPVCPPPCAVSAAAHVCGASPPHDSFPFCSLSVMPFPCRPLVHPKPDISILLKPDITNLDLHE